MAYGVIEYDAQGNPICEICKKSFRRVLTHVRQKHNMNERAYKRKFGFDLSKGICSKESSELSSIMVYSNYERCINRNLIKRGVKTRFKKGDPGRTRDQVQEQTRIALIARIKSEPRMQASKEQARKLGKSGLGNTARWGKK